MSAPSHWLALTIGNSRLHWGAIAHHELLTTGSWPHLHQPARRDRLPSESQDWPIFFASVVPTQSLLWSDVPDCQPLTLDDIPLAGKYATLGCDRALAAYGAMMRYGVPVLVIDGGTAWTLTAVDAQGTLLGGAILPGLALQFQSLHRNTGQLPNLTIPDVLPPHWGQTTATAIESGIVHTLLSGLKHFIQIWEVDYPDGQIVLTGGSSAWLNQHLGATKSHLHHEPHLILKGMVTLLSSE